MYSSLNPYVFWPLQLSCLKLIAQLYSHRQTASVKSLYYQASRQPTKVYSQTELRVQILYQINYVEQTIPFLSF